MKQINDIWKDQTEGQPFRGRLSNNWNQPKVNKTSSTGWVNRYERRNIWKAIPENEIVLLYVEGENEVKLVTNANFMTSGPIRKWKET